MRLLVLPDAPAARRGFAVAASRRTLLVVTPAPDSALTAEARPRRPSRRTPARSRWPVSIRWGVPLIAVALLAHFALRQWRDSFAYVRLLNSDGGAIKGGLLEFFAFEEAGDAPSPSPKLCELRVDDDGEAVLDSSHVPGAALFRVTAPGYGVGYGVARVGEVVAAELNPPMQVSGTVLFAGKAPAAGARVDVFAGGARGVKIGEAVVSADGRFVVDGVDSRLAYLHLRVFHAGHTMVAQDWVVDGGSDIDLRLQPTLPLEGRIALPAGVDGRTLRLRVYNLPGVETAVAEDGRFLFDCLPPPPLRLRLLVVGLGEEWTHPRTLVEAGERDVEIVIRRSARIAGRVIDGLGRPVASAAVVHEHGPRGKQVARCDAAGGFVIGRVPDGSIDLHAESFTRDKQMQGERVVLAAEGETIDDVTIVIE